MRTLPSIPPGDLVVVGRLTFARTGPSRRPSLRLDFFDPFGHTPRSAAVPDDFRPDAVIEILPDTTPGPAASAWIMADPGSRPEVLAVIAHFRERLGAWRAEQRAAGNLADRAKILAT